MGETIYRKSERMKIKKCCSSIIVLVFLVSMMTVVNATGQMSSWAVDEVTESISNELVPEEFQSDYQNNIKRYEYVLLANQIVDLMNRHVKIEIEFPFSDIYGHDYEHEIVKAYNAGIIEGDGDGIFRPDDFITRQEIASLICHLIKVVDPSADWSNTLKVKYSDDKEIADWARNYINYCYTRGILQGVGQDTDGLDTMNPLGNATKEQAIVLLLRLAKRYELIQEYDLGTIDILSHIGDDYDNIRRVGTKYYRVTDIINDFTSYTSFSLGSYILELSEDERVDVVGMDEDFTQLVFKDLGNFNFIQTMHHIDIRMTVDTLDENLLIDAFMHVVSIYTDVEPIETMLTRNRSQLPFAEPYYFSESIGEGVYIEIRYNMEHENYQYYIQIDNEI